MAIYHLSMKPVGRAGGRSATAAAAYRAAEKIHDLASGEVFDFTRKRSVEHTEIVLPAKAAQQNINWPRDRQALWNAAEAAEKRKDARVAREYEVALPAELTKAQRKELVREFAGYLANRYGVAVDIAMHRPHRAGDTRNHHAHLLTTTREITATGLGAKTDIELGDRDRAKKGLGTGAEELIHNREHWASLSNAHLKRLGFDARIDHRSLEAQGIEREPTVHLGPAVTALQRRGIETEVERRIAWQEQERALERLDLAAELGRIEREKQHTAGLIELESSLPAAQHAREQALLGLEPQRETLSLEQRQKAAAEQWLAKLEARERCAALDGTETSTKDLGHSLGAGLEQAAERARDHGHSLDGPDDGFGL